MPSEYIIVLILDIIPGTSLWCVTIVGLPPVNSIDWPSIDVITIFPPPIEEPMISDTVPSVFLITNLTVLGWASPKSVSINSYFKPFSLAISKDFPRFSSQGSIFNIPAIKALSVPCPL